MPPCFLGLSSVSPLHTLGSPWIPLDALGSPSPPVSCVQEAGFEDTAAPDGSPLDHPHPRIPSDALGSPSPPGRPHPHPGMTPSCKALSRPHLHKGC